MHICCTHNNVEVLEAWQIVEKMLPFQNVGSEFHCYAIHSLYMDVKRSYPKLFNPIQS